MDTIKLSAQGVVPFMHLISGDVAEEIEAAKEVHPGNGAIGDGFHVYGLFDEEEMIPIGALAIQKAGYTLIIRSLYVEPAFREKGGAEMLVNAVRAEALRNADILEIEFVAAGNSNEQMEVARYLAGIGFDMEESDEKYFRATIGEIDEAGVIKNVPTSGVIPLRDVEDRLIRSFGNDSATKDNTFVQLPIVKDDYDTDISMAVIRNNEIFDLVLVARDEEGLILQYVYAKESGRSIIAALSAAVGVAREKLGEQAVVRIPTVKEAGSRLVEKIIPKARVSDYVKCTYQMMPVYETVYGKR